LKILEDFLQILDKNHQNIVYLAEAKQLVSNNCLEVKKKLYLRFIGENRNSGHFQVIHILHQILFF